MLGYKIQLMLSKIITLWCGGIILRYWLISIVRPEMCNKGDKNGQHTYYVIEYSIDTILIMSI